MLAKDIMTSPVPTLPVGATVFEAAKLLVSIDLGAVPVVDEWQRMVGILSEADLMYREEIGTRQHRSWLSRLFTDDAQLAAEYVRTHSQHVTDLMTRTVVYAGAEATLGALSTLMETHVVRQIPILRHRAIVGIVSRKSLLRALLAAADAHKQSPSDEETRDAVVLELDRQGWSTPWPKNVVVKDGVVHLSGFITSDSMRDAYRVAAENVPGVRHVEDHLQVAPASLAMGI